MLRILQKRVLGSLRTQCSRVMSTDPNDTATYDNTSVEDETSDGSKRRPERCVNRVTLIGRVGRDPDHRGNEHPVLIFPLATNLLYRKSNGELMTKTDWHRICVFRPGLRDNVASRVKRGDRLFVEGSISYVRHTDDSGTSTSITSINADEIMFLGRPANRKDDDDEGEI